MQALLSDSRGAHAREISHLSAERDAIAEQLTAQRAQCRQWEAELEALRQDLPSAIEGALHTLHQCHTSLMHGTAFRADGLVWGFRGDVDSKRMKMPSTWAVCRLVLPCIIGTGSRQ